MSNFIKAIGLILSKFIYLCNRKNFVVVTSTAFHLIVQISMDASWCFFVLNKRFVSGCYI